MSWIPITRWFALASLAWLAPAFAQSPQLAPPQYGISDGAPRGYTDPSPPPNLTPAPATDDREYLRLLNQPAASSTPAAVNPTPAATAPSNYTLGNSSPANPPAMNPVNIAARSEPQPAGPNIQATYTQPITPEAVTPAAQPQNNPAPIVPAGNNAPLNPAPANNVPRTMNTNGAKPIPLAGPNTKSPVAASGWGSFGTMLGSLAIVLGLFVVTIKLLRRGLPGAKQRLARDVVEVLGQTPLAPRQTLQVIRFGNKILLVAMSPDGCDTLTEITDPLEVDRVAGMCQQSQANSSTKTFGEMFRQVTSMRPTISEPADEAPAHSSTLDEVRAQLRGGSVAGREVTHG